MTLSLLLIGIASSLVSEAISWVNVHWLASTPFKGQAAWWIAAVVSIVGGFVYEFFYAGVQVVDMQSLGFAIAAAFGVSQIWFGTISTWFSKYLQA